jgi:hypothetical protein
MPTNIRMAKISLTKLEDVGQNPPDLPEPSFLKIDGIILILGFLSVIIYILTKWEPWKRISNK